MGLRLDFNENTLECSPEVLRVLRTIGSADLTKYPEREPCREAGRRTFGTSVRNKLLLTNGVDEAIHVLCQTYLEAGDELLLPVPTYSMYEVYASATEAESSTVQAARDFRFPEA